MSDTERTRVVITGLGVVSSIGLGIDAFTASLREGRSGASPIQVFDTTGYESPVGCEVREFDPVPWFTRLSPHGVGRSSQFSVAAARMAMLDAGLDEEKGKEYRKMLNPEELSKFNKSHDITDYYIEFVVDGA